MIYECCFGEAKGDYPFCPEHAGDAVVGTSYTCPECGLRWVNQTMCPHRITPEDREQDAVRVPPGSMTDATGWSRP